MTTDLKKLRFVCPACKAVGIKSRCEVEVGDIKSSPEDAEEFYDESGTYHFHEPDPLWLAFQCYNGHRGSIVPDFRCEACDFAVNGSIRLFGKLGGVMAQYDLNGKLLDAISNAGVQ